MGVRSSCSTSTMPVSMLGWPVATVGGLGGESTTCTSATHGDPAGSSSSSSCCVLCVPCPLSDMGVASSTDEAEMYTPGRSTISTIPAGGSCTATPGVADLRSTCIARQSDAAPSSSLASWLSVLGDTAASAATLPDASSVSSICHRSLTLVGPRGLPLNDGERSGVSGESHWSSGA